MGYNLIETVEIGAGGAATIEFIDIPQDGVDLICLISERHTDTGNIITVKLNGDGGSNYTVKQLLGYGSGVQVNSYSNFAPFGPVGQRGDWTANTFGNVAVRISNYTGATTKVVSHDGVTENGATLAYSSIGCLTWSTTDPVTSLVLGTNFAQYSTASLYKITAD